MYKVIKYFTDLTDSNFPYNVGDVFPRDGLTVTEERLAELAGKDNKQGEPLIKYIKPAAPRTAKKKQAEAETPAEE